MYGDKKPRIRVYPLRENSSQYVATFHSDVLDATFSVTFRETITGAIALHTFVELHRKQYGHPVEIAVMNAYGLPDDSPVRDMLNSLEKIFSHFLALLNAAAAPRPCGVAGEIC